MNAEKPLEPPALEAETSKLHWRGLLQLTELYGQAGVVVLKAMLVDVPAPKGERNPITGSNTGTVYETVPQPFWLEPPQPKMKSPTPAPLLNVSPAGTLGGWRGVTLLTGSEAVLPPPLTAITVTLKAVQLLSPITVALRVAPDTVVCVIAPAGATCAWTT